MDNFDLKKYLIENKSTFSSRLNENEEYNDIVQKLKSKYSLEGIEIKNNKIYFRTYYKNGSIKNWYTLEKMEDGTYRFTKGGIQKVDWPIEKLLNYLLHSIID